MVYDRDIMAETPSGEKSFAARGEPARFDLIWWRLQIFGTAVVVIVSVTFKSPEFCKFGVAVG